MEVKLILSHVIPRSSGRESKKVIEFGPPLIRGFCVFYTDGH